MHFNRRKFLGAVAAGGLSAPTIVRSAFAQADFPNKPITFICPFEPGSGADVFTRFYAKQLEALSGVASIVENKTGASGLIGAGTVARARPDGYTALIVPGVGVLAASPSLFKSVPFDPLNDFEHVTTLHKTVLVLVVPAESPFKTAQELVAHLKEKGEDAAYAAVSNTSQVISETFKAQFALKTRAVRFPNFPPALNEMRAGNVAFVFLDNQQAAAHIAAGRIRGLTLASAERLDSIPEIPGARESGIPNMDFTQWTSVHLPKGTPAPIVQKYLEWFHKIVASEETAKFFKTIAASPFPNSPEKTKAMLKEEMDKWATYTKLAGIQPQ